MKKGFTNTPVILSASEGSRNCFTPYVIASSTNSERSVGAKVARQSQSGFTLMELLVYMMIVGIIVLVAGQAFTDSTKFRIRTQNMLKATQEAENVATLFKSDVSQMGAKSSKEAGNADGGKEYGDKFSEINPDVYIDPANASEDLIDSSSFLISASSGQSDLTFKRVRYNNTSGLYEATEKIRWFVENNILKRSCQTVSPSGETSECPNDENSAYEKAVEIATDVDTFKVIAPEPVTQAEEQIFPKPTDDFRLIPTEGENICGNFKTANSSDTENGYGEEIKLSSFCTNYDAAQNKIKDDAKDKNQVVAVNKEDPTSPGWKWKDYCQDETWGLIPLEENNTYEISFEVPFISLSTDFDAQPFVPGEDHMSVGFIGKNSGKPPTIKVDGKTIPLIEDFMFFPPYNSEGNGKRYMRFTVPADIDTVCLAFTFASFSPKASEAKLKIKNLKIKKIPGLNYRFDRENPYDPEAHKNDKKNIKALQLILDIARGKKNGGNGETGHVEVVVPTPSNGPRD